MTLLNTAATRGLKLIKSFALMSIFPQCFNLLFLLIFQLFFCSNDIPIYALFASLTLTGLIGAAITEITFKRRISPTDTVQQISIKTILSISLPMLLTATMTFIIGQTGVLMLGMFKSNAEVGYYGIAVKLATLTSFILVAINSMAAPKFSELYHSNNIEELFYIAQKSSKLIFYTTTPILVVLILFGKIILEVAFGTDFIIAYPALIILVIGQFFHSISGATGFFMNMTGNEKLFRNIMILTAILNILLNYFLIPKFGIVGASISAMACIILWNITCLIFMKNKFGTTTGYFPFLTQSVANHQYL